MMKGEGDGDGVRRSSLLTPHSPLPGAVVLFVLTFVLLTLFRAYIYKYIM